MEFKTDKKGLDKRFDCENDLIGLVCFDEKDGSEKCSGTDMHIQFYSYCVKCSNYVGPELGKKLREAENA
jgi:hypothetical protein